MLARSWSWSAIVLLLGGIVVALLTFAACFGFSRKEAVTGVVVPAGGWVRVAAPQAGVLVRVHVAEGQVVQPGDVLFTLSGERSSSRGNTQTDITRSLQVRADALRTEITRRAAQTRLRGGDLRIRLASLAASLEQQETELGLQRQRTQLAREVAARWAELARQGAQTAAAASDKAAEALDQATRLSALERSAETLRRERAELAYQLSELPMQAARETSALEREIEEINQQSSESEARRLLLVRAERAGRVAVIVPREGQTILAGDRLANVLPALGPLEAELYVPTRAIAFVKPGLEVLLRYDAFPYQRYGQQTGAVREVALAAVPIGELMDRRPGTSDSASSDQESVYRIRVSLDSQHFMAGGERHSIRPGMQVSASLVLERRTLLQWALEPMQTTLARL